MRGKPIAETIAFLRRHPTVLCNRDQRTALLFSEGGAPSTRTYSEDRSVHRFIVPTERLTTTLDGKRINILMYHPLGESSAPMKAHRSTYCDHRPLRQPDGLSGAFG